MSKKLKNKIISCTSEQTQYPVSSLLFNGSNGGWQSKRFCTYPQEITFEFYGIVHIDKIQLISNGKKIPSQVDILYFMPFKSNQSDQRFQKYGFLNFNRNNSSQMKEQKSIMVDINCLYLRFLFHKPHHSKENFFSQVGIQQISIYGTDTKGNFDVLDKLEKMPRQIGSNEGQMNPSPDQDPFIYEKVVYLTSLKDNAVAQQDFQSATGYKSMIDEIKKMDKQLQKLHKQKQQAIRQEDYEKANDFKKSIQSHKRQIQKLLNENLNQSMMDYGNNERGGQNGNYQQQNDQMNDFQDNEFVDPEINENFNKNNSTLSNRSRKDGQKSRINLGKSRMNKRDSRLEQIQNYDQKVIPTLANNSKLKTQQSQLGAEQQLQEKKFEIQPEQIDGKYVQFAVVLQEHFPEELIKKFFSKHWQLKVSALTKIHAQNKSKSDASYIKCLIVVVKNSINETNFQVALNSLVVLEDLLSINGKSKGGVLSRNNEMVNDLDSIMRETLKKMTDNNQKIKQQGEKVFRQMVNSALYGPEACTTALVKNKQSKNAKLSTKQIIMRLFQAEKIVQKYGSENVHIVSLSVDFGIQHSNNPAIQVRNQAVSLLVICQKVNMQQFMKKSSGIPKILELIQTHQEKNSKNQKGKKKK